MTTVEDLAKWNANFEKPVVGDGTFLSAILERGKLRGGAEIPFASGLSHLTIHGVPAVSHGVSGAGYRSAVAPDEPEVPLSAEEIDRCTGTWWSDDSAQARTIAADDGKLVAMQGGTKMALRHIGGGRVVVPGPQPVVTDTFSTPSGALRFTRDAAGKIDGFRLEAGRVRGLRFEKETR